MRTILPLFLLAALFLRELTSKRILQLKARLAVTESTLRRWRKWFDEIFPNTKTLRRLKGIAPGFFYVQGIKRLVLPLLWGRNQDAISTYLRLLAELHIEKFTLHDGLSPPAENG